MNTFEYPMSSSFMLYPLESNKVIVTFSTVKLVQALSIVNTKTNDKDYRYTVEICKDIIGKLDGLKNKSYDTFILLRYIQTLFYLKNHKVLIFIDHNYSAYIVINDHNTGICINQNHVISIDPDKVN